MSATFSFHRVDPRNKALMEKVYRIRYQVYCLGCGFENPENYPDGMEKDKYDPCSIHFLAMDADIPVGTVRLIRNHDLRFPIEEHCGINIKSDRVPRDSLVEISRLAVSNLYQRMAKNKLPNRCGCPDIALGLYRMIYHEIKRLGIRYWCAAMDKGLARLLNKFHIVFDKVGDQVDYHGPRIPFVGSVDKFEQEMIACKSSGIYDFFVEGLEEEYIPSHKHPYSEVTTKQENHLTLPSPEHRIKQNRAHGPWFFELPASTCFTGPAQR